MLSIPGYQSGFARHGSMSEAPELRRRLAGAWIPPFGQTGYGVRDVSGYGNHGLFKGSDDLVANYPTWDMTKGRRNIRYFPALGDGIICGQSLFNTGEFTILAWVHTGTILSAVTVCAQASGGANYNFAFEIGRDAAHNKLGVIWGGALTTFASNTALVANTWYHVGIQRRGVAGAWTAEAFLNGRADGSATTTTNPNGAAGSFTSIGMFYTTGSGIERVFNGIISDLCLWNYALPKAAIYRHYVDSMAMWRIREDAVAGGAAPAQTGAWWHQHILRRPAA